MPGAAIKGSGRLVAINKSTKRDGTASRSIYTYDGPTFRPTGIEELATQFEGVSFLTMTDATLQDGRPHQCEMVAAYCSILARSEIHGYGSDKPGTNYGAVFNSCRGIEVFKTTATDCRNGLVFSDCEVCNVTDFATTGCTQSAISLRGFTNDVFIRDCEQLDKIVIGNTEWPGRIRDIRVQNCKPLGIEIQGDAECTITNCNVARGVMLCQILNHDGTIDAPSVDIYGGSRAWLRYYTLAADGKTVVKGHPFKGRVALDGRTQVVTES